MVANMVLPIAPHLAYAALHHDSAEAYLADICSPTKKYLYLHYTNCAGIQVVESFADAEDRVENAIFKALGIVKPDSLGQAMIKTADRAALRRECDHLMHPFPTDDPIYSIAIPRVTIDESWAPSYAESRFLNLDKELRALTAPKV